MMAMAEKDSPCGQSTGDQANRADDRVEVPEGQSGAGFIEGATHTHALG